jgi:hypothetical protein
MTVRILFARPSKRAEPKRRRYATMSLRPSTGLCRYIEETEGINILRVPMPASYQLK